MLANKTITGTAAGQGDRPSHRELALLLYNERRSRDVLLPTGRALWGDPAWDMLLDLFVANEENRRVNIVSACIGGCIPTTTGLRLVGQLIDAGLVVRTTDPKDGRKGMLGLTPETTDAMRRYLDEIVQRRRSNSGIDLASLDLPSRQRGPTGTPTREGHLSATSSGA